MQTFRKYITEAKVSKSNLNKVADIFKRMLEKHLGSKLYRFGGVKGYSEIKSGLGILYFYGSNKAIRINYNGKEIVSITLWNSYRLGVKGDYTINLEGIGLLEGGKRVIEFIRNPKVGKHGVVGNLREDFQQLDEAKRISPDKFVELIYKNRSSMDSMNSMRWDDIKAIAVESDVLVPSVITSVQIGKGRNRRFDLTKLSDAANSGKVSKDNVPTYYVKITAQDPETKKFVSVIGDKKAEKMLKTMTGSLNNPDVKTEMKNPDTLFGIMGNLTQLVARGSRNSLIVYGGPGIGKTYVVNEMLNAEGLKKGTDWYVVKGKITTSSLYQTLFMHRKGGILVFDDTDSVWSDKEAANILKAALDSYDERIISWLSNRTVNVSKLDQAAKEELNTNLDYKLASEPGDGGIKLPSEFDFNGRIIFISNLPYEKFDSAVLTRSAKIDMTLTPEQIFMRMRSIITKGGLGAKDVPENIKNEIVDYLIAQNATGDLSGISLRTYVAAEDLYRSGLPNWKDLLAYV